MISEKATYDTVIVSDQNISREKLNEQLSRIETLDKESGRIFILTKKEHPNTYGYDPDSLIKILKINEAHFTELMDRVKQ